MGKPIAGSRVRRQLWAAPLILLGSAACSEPPAPKSHSAAAAAAEQKGSSQVQDQSQGPAVSGLPFSQGQSFTSLDEYLEFRRKRGAYDVPWYREIRPGVYELVSRRGPGAKPEIYTREELAREFGFDR